MNQKWRPKPPAGSYNTRTLCTSLTPEKTNHPARAILSQEKRRVPPEVQSTVLLIRVAPTSAMGRLRLRSHLGFATSPQLPTDYNTSSRRRPRSSDHLDHNDDESAKASLHNARPFLFRKELRWNEVPESTPEPYRNNSSRYYSRNTLATDIPHKYSNTPHLFRITR